MLGVWGISYNYTIHAPLAHMYAAPMETPESKQVDARLHTRHRTPLNHLSLLWQPSSNESL